MSILDYPLPPEDDNRTLCLLVLWRWTKRERAKRDKDTGKEVIRAVERAQSNETASNVS